MSGVDITSLFGMPLWAFYLLLAWSLIWKGAGLWVASRSNQKGWFIAILIINSIGILEAIYLFAVKKGKWPKEVVVDRVPK